MRNILSITKKAIFKKSNHICWTIYVSKSIFQYIVHLCKSFEYGTLIYENCTVSEVTIEKYAGLL